MWLRSGWATQNPWPAGQIQGQALARPSPNTEHMLQSIEMVVHAFNQISQFAVNIEKFQQNVSKFTAKNPNSHEKYTSTYIPGDILAPSLETSSGNQTEPNLSIGSTEIFLVVLKPNQLGESDSTSIST